MSKMEINDQTGIDKSKVAPEIDRHDIPLKERERHTADLARRSAEILMPERCRHIGTLTLHFYAESQLGVERPCMIKQMSQWDVSEETFLNLMPEFRDQMLITYGKKPLKRVK